MFGWFKKKAAATPVRDWEEYNGYRICATPLKDGAQFRISGIIEKGEGDEVKSHSFVRADLIPSEQEAISFSLMKARLMIDQMGDRLFNDQ